MSQSLLIKKGLEGLFSPEKKFESEAAYGRKILYVAWAVEILAAAIGLTIAWATAYDAYNANDNPDESALISAIIGGLPFLVIAVIEPTKIPLAGGFYKTRILGWKILILIALVGLTTVTFETMFNGLERNLTNVTKEVVDADNDIRFLSDQLDETKRELEDLRSKSVTALTSDLQKALDKLRSDYQSDVNGIRETSESQIFPLENEKVSKQNAFIAIGGEAGKTTQAQIDVLRAKINDLQNSIQKLQNERDEKIQTYKDDALTTAAGNQAGTQNKIDRLKSEKIEALEEIKGHKTAINESEDKLENQLTKFGDTLDVKLTKLDGEETEEISRLGIFDPSQPVKNRYATRRESLVEATEEKKQNARNSAARIKNESNIAIKNLQDKVNDLDRQIQKEIAGAPPGIPVIDQEEIDKISAQYDAKISQLRTQELKAQSDISDAIEAQTGVAEKDKEKLRDQIAVLDERIEGIAASRDRSLEDRLTDYSAAKADLEKARNERILDIKREKDAIPGLEKKVVNLSNQIDKTKKVKREASYESQIYRLAALAYGKADVADVTRDQIKVVSVVWFGSIALIVSTIGTILALISYILRDPEAFVERPRMSIALRIGRLSYVLFGRVSRLLLTLINVLTATIKLLISMAEIFRGFIGVPLQRAVRRTLAAYRRRLNNPRIVEIVKEVEVEKVVEKEVEKIVEKEIERIIEKEVPVDKVVIKEVPKEIVRKELVYVPLYSTEAGLVDATTELRGAKPHLYREHNSEREGNSKSASYQKQSGRDLRDSVETNPTKEEGIASEDIAKVAE